MTSSFPDHQQDFPKGPPAYHAGTFVFIHRLTHAAFWKALCLTPVIFQGDLYVFMADEFSWESWMLPDYWGVWFISNLQTKKKEKKNKFKKFNSVLCRCKDSFLFFCPESCIESFISLPDRSVPRSLLLLHLIIHEIMKIITGNLENWLTADKVNRNVTNNYNQKQINLIICCFNLSQMFC